MGGTCLNVGCIPTKTLLYGAKQYYNAKNAAKYGVTASDVSFDYAKMAQRKTKVVRKLVAGIKQRLNNAHCTVVNGAAEVVSRTDEKVVIRCNEQEFEAEKITAYQLYEERKEFGRYLIAYEFDKAVCTEHGGISGTEAFIGDDKKAQQSGGGIAQKSIEKALFLVKRNPKQKRCEEKKRKARGV